jgi:AcrR family transcriptional regulator
MPRHRVNTARTAPRKRRARGATAPPVLRVVDQLGRERILAAAIRSFSEAGYEGTTTAGVARDARVTQPLVHHHFGSKEGLWRAAMDMLFSNVSRVVAIPADVSPQDRLVVGAERFVRFVAEHPEITRIVAREGAAASPRLTYLVDRYLREPFQQMVEATRAGQRAGLIAADVRPDLLLFVILGAGSHLFDVTALARESVGIDATDTRTREDFVVLMRALLEGGLFGSTPKHRRTRA